MSSHIRTLFFPASLTSRADPSLKKGNLFVHDPSSVNSVNLNWIKEKYLCNFECILCCKNIEHWGAQKGWGTLATGIQVKEIIETQTSDKSRAGAATDRHPVAKMHPPTKKWMRGEAILSIWANTERHIQPASTYMEKKAINNITNAWNLPCYVPLPSHTHRGKWTFTKTGLSLWSCKPFRYQEFLGLNPRMKER